MGKNNKLLAIYRRLQKIYRYGSYKIKWWYYYGLRKGQGIKSSSINDDLIVSMTSYPARINYVYEALQSLLLQSLRPKKIILWLSDEEFPNKLDDLPDSILKLQDYGIEIMWCENIGAYKKLVPAIKKFRESIIVTTDDDVCYGPTWLEQLYKTHLKYPDCICAHRITKFLIKDDNYIIESGGYDKWDQPSVLNKLTGCGGVLYPAMLYKDEHFFDEQLFSSICKTNDDIWFWLMAVKEGVKVMPVRNSRSLPIVTVPHSHEGGTLSDINDKGDHLFWKDFNNMISEYPQIDEILRKEYESLTNTR